MSNNFNMSSTGFQVEVNARYDRLLSQLFFNDNFISEDNEESLFFTGCELTRDDFIITVNDTPKNREIFDYDNIYSIEDIVPQWCYDNGIKTVYEELKELDYIGAEYTTNFHTVVSRGYSQGDCLEVYVLNDYPTNEEEINHYLWDAPVSFSVTINGGGVLYEDDVLTDFYEWDGDEVRGRAEEALKKQGYNDVCVAEVLGLIPNNLEYA